MPTFIVLLLTVALILAVAGHLTVTASVLLLVFAGLLFGVFVNGLAGWATRKLSAPYLVSYLAVVAILFSGSGLGLYYLGSQIADRIYEFSTELESAIGSAGERLSQYAWAERFLAESPSWQELFAEKSGAILPAMFNGLRWATWAGTAALVILFVGLYAAYEPDLYRTGLIKLAPIGRRERLREVLTQLNAALGDWIVGRLISMTIVGATTAVGLWLFGVPVPLTLGVVAALLTFIPNIGPLLAAIPQVLLAWDVGADTAAYVLIFNLALQGVESYLISPLVQRRQVELPPILTIAAQLLMGVLFGVVGVMMAAPLVVALMVITQMLYIQDYLGDADPGELTADA